MTVLWEPTLDDEAAHWRDLARTVAAERFAPLAGELDTSSATSASTSRPSSKPACPACWCPPNPAAGHCR